MLETHFNDSRSGAASPLQSGLQYPLASGAWSALPHLDSGHGI